MPGSGRAEIYFIAAMMILIIILAIAAVYIFIKTYKREMREKAEREEAKKQFGAPKAGIQGSDN
jgi:positive regulator of sigma E activity